jgi:hypothetical protein
VAARGTGAAAGEAADHWVLGCDYGLGPEREWSDAFIQVMANCR